MRTWILLSLLGGCHEYALSGVATADTAAPSPAPTPPAAQEAWDDVVTTLVEQPPAVDIVPEHEDPGVEADADASPDLSTCEAGYQATYYNLPATHPDMMGPVEGLQLGIQPAQLDWFSAPYFWEDRVDTDLMFGDDWWPVSAGEPGDPAHFAVHWRGWIEAESARIVTFFLASDDDAWVLIDGAVVADQGGVHVAEERCYSVALDAGVHRIDIYAADRDASASSMWLEWADAVEVMACSED
jgi:fibro-slime domain-containing protein